MKASCDGRHRPAAVEHLTITVLLIDGLVTFGALALAYSLRFLTPLRNVGYLDADLTIDRYFGHFALGAAALAAIFAQHRLYENQFLLSPRRSFPRISRGCLVWFVCYLAASMFLRVTPPLSRGFCVIATGVILIALTIWRYFLTKLIWKTQRARALIRRALFLGWNQDCADAGHIMTHDPGSPVRIVGAIRPPGRDFALPLPTMAKDYGHFEHLAEVLASGEVEMLVTTDSELDREHQARVISLCEKEMIDFQLVPTCFRVLLGGLHLDNAYGMPMLGITKLPLHSKLNLCAKRVIDTVGGVVGLALSLPLIAVFGLLIYLESPGPIFYRQRRVGQKGREFDLIKLRSMKLDSEADTGAVWTVENDPRCLKIGRFIRAWNIDEVPQFWNVIKGEMSLVGPRPERPELIAMFRDTIPHYNARHSIKPGITGWAQVNGLRGNTDLGERIKYDLHYIERWNLLLDFQIMLLTFFRRENAY